MKKIITYILSTFIHCYQKYISPLFPATCKFYPTCSEYALKSIQKHGPIKGSALAIQRILRCNPFNGGGYDPVP